MAIEKTYSDFDLDFLAHPLSGDVVKVFDDNAVKASVELLLDMDYYETPFNPTKGSKVKRLLFEPMGIDIIIEMKEAVTEVLEKYEPRIEIVEVGVEADFDNATYEVKIIFKILNNINLSVIEFILQKVN